MMPQAVPRYPPWFLMVSMPTVDYGIALELISPYSQLPGCFTHISFVVLNSVGYLTLFVSMSYFCYRLLR
jgi:hypothetical protein